MEAKPKITKHVYNARRVDFEHQIQTIQEQLEEADRTNGASLGKATQDETSNAWNALHDHIHDINEAIRDLDREWETHDWTSQDFQQWRLICENVD